MSYSLLTSRLTNVLSLFLIAGITTFGCSDGDDVVPPNSTGGGGGVGGENEGGGGAGQSGAPGEGGASGSVHGGRDAGGASGASGPGGTAGTPAGGVGGESGAAPADAGGGNGGGAGLQGTGGAAGAGGVGGASAGAGGAAGSDAAGAGGLGGAGDAGGAGLPVGNPTELADESAVDYADNEHGVITGDTLKSWITAWGQNRPAAASGKLVILQVVPNVANSLAHVAGNGNDVVSYLVPSSELTQVRDNGLSRIEAEIPDGQRADAFLAKYGIDVAKDYVVLTFEQLADTQNSIVQSVGRAWLLLRYWGYPKQRIGILNGSVNWNATAHGLVTSATATTAPNDGTSSVSELWVDNTSYVITLSGLLAILKAEPQATPLAGVSIVDARGGAEALGLLKATSTGKTDCTSYTGTGTNTRCSPPFEGRIKGANSVPWPQFLDSSANGFRFFPKATVKTTFDTQAEYQPGQLTIQYCRTNMRSMVTGLVANVILGYPTRFYDTSFIEWSHLAYGPTARSRVLPADSRFRTDLTTLTEHADVANYTPGGSIEGITINGWVDGPNYNADADISPTAPLVTPTATTTNLSVDTDRAYKLD